MTGTTQPDSAVAFDETPAIEVSDVHIDSTPEMFCVDVALADASCLRALLAQRW